MNTNPNIKRILCFGDSNTWGRKPGDDNSARFKPNVRWTGILQDLLSKKYEVIEEGLNGRTANLNSPDKIGKNGALFLYPCLESQKPIDVVILQLGKNNLKSKYKASPKSVALGVEECLKAIQKEGKNKYNKTPKIILLPVIPIVEKINMHAGRLENAFVGANKKCISLLPLYQEIAHKYKIEFLDITKFVKVSNIDGVHMTANSHKIIGTKIAELLT